MRRFYTEASVIQTVAGFGISLDSRDLSTPARNPLHVPSRPLAEAIAQEWNAQGQRVDLATMSLGGIANAAIDLASPDLAAFAAPIAAYGESDLLVYRSPDPDLATQQARLWNPLLDWAEQRWQVEFVPTEGIMHVAQPTATRAALSREVMACDSFALAALSPVVSIGGSLVVGLALLHDAFPAEHLWDAVTLDERWQEERWGAVDDAVEAREEKHVAWLNAARFLELLAAGR